MAKAPPPPIDRRYPNRSADILQVNLSLDRTAVRVLREHASGQRGQGKFLSQLLHEFDQRGQFENLWKKAGKDLKHVLRTVQKEVRRETNHQK
jgi:hypothetical protein